MGLSSPSDSTFCEIQEFPGKPAGEFRFFFCHPRCTVLDIMPRDPHLVERAQECQEPEITREQVPEGNNSAGMTAFRISPGEEECPCTVERAVVCCQLRHLVFPDTKGFFCRMKEPFSGIERCGNPCGGRTVFFQEAVLRAGFPVHGSAPAKRI